MNRSPRFPVMLRITAAVITAGLLVLPLALQAQGVNLGQVLQAPAVLNDQSISDKIDLELAADVAIPSYKIDVVTSKGVVTLSGSVGNLLARNRAASVAETVKGVRAVINRIEVITPLRPDRDIEADISDALKLDPAAHADRVTVSVNQGSVTLTGQTGSWSEQQLLGRLAESIRGVKSVENTVAIVYSKSRSDGDIIADIKTRLRWDRFVDDALIDVKVSNGKVTLSGAVGSAAEKSTAMTGAWAIGVNSVDASKLDVRFWARDPKLREGKYVYKSDTAIRNAVKAALLYDPRVDYLNTTVDVSGGVVTLRGKARSVRGKRAAAENARNTVGVLDVRDRVKVRPKAEPTDEQLAAQIKIALRRDAYVEQYEVNTNVIDGVAYLSGAVDTYFEKARAESIAEGIIGIFAVRNNIDVDHLGLPLINNPYVAYGYYPYDYEWWTDGWNRPPATVNKPDSEILQAIKEELWWSPFVNLDEVNVRVELGVATLEGTVDSWSEWSAATENALKGGAIRVVNRLKVGST